MKTHHLRRCDILLYRRPDFTSRLLQLGSGNAYSHVAVVIEPHIRLAVGSNAGHPSGMRAIDLKMIDDTQVEAFRVKPEFGYDGDRMIAFLIAHLEIGYDFKGIAWLGLLKGVSSLTGFLWKPFNCHQKEKDYFCSELCYAAFMAGGLDLVPQVNETEIILPNDIAQSERLEKVAP